MRLPRQKPLVRTSRTIAQSTSTTALEHLDAATIEFVTLPPFCRQ
jgi:hypothetical protein